MNFLLLVRIANLSTRAQAFFSLLHSKLSLAILSLLAPWVYFSGFWARFGFHTTFPSLRGFAYNNTPRFSNFTTISIFCPIKTLKISTHFKRKSKRIVFQDEFRWSVVKTVGLFAFGVYMSRELRGVDLIGSGPS
jgi:hypothetical protein